MKFRLASLTALLLSAASLNAQTAAVPSYKCSELSKLSLPSVSVELAQVVTAGAFRLSNEFYPSESETELFKHAPAFCRVVLKMTPTSDSKISVEVWMPIQGWNKKFRGQGNGGFAGEIDYRGLASTVALGYATAGTDTGHVGLFTDGSWALGHPEKVVDFGYRAIHEMTLSAKKIVQAYYGNAPERSYFASCSTGGRQGLMEAQRFPDDYDGILAGAPANNWTGLMTNAVANEQALALRNASYIPPAKLPAISAAVIAACDAQDGVTDGILNDPPKCSFDPTTLRCKSVETDKCLTEQQVQSLQSLYAGTRDAKGKLIFPGYPPGAELGADGWEPWILGSAAGHSLMAIIGNQYFSNMVYQDPAWSFKTFSIEEGFKAATRQTSKALDAMNPNLKAFAAHGGKLILFHGWNDPAISALSTIDYYDSLRATMGGAHADSFARLFLAPGMQHCYGGPGPNSFGQYEQVAPSGPDNPQHNLYIALERWVEDGVAPESVIAAKYGPQDTDKTIVVTRPLCAYPQIAAYKGSGDKNKADNFTCSLVKKHPYFK